MQCTAAPKRAPSYAVLHSIFLDPFVVLGFFDGCFVLPQFPGTKEPTARNEQTDNIRTPRLFLCHCRCFLFAMYALCFVGVACPCRGGNALAVLCPYLCCVSVATSDCFLGALPFPDGILLSPLTPPLSFSLLLSCKYTFAHTIIFYLSEFSLFFVLFFLFLFRRMFSFLFLWVMISLLCTRL